MPVLLTNRLERENIVVKETTLKKQTVDDKGLNHRERKMILTKTMHGNVLLMIHVK